MLCTIAQPATRFLENLFLEKIFYREINMYLVEMFIESFLVKQKFIFTHNIYHKLKLEQVHTQKIIYFHSPSLNI